MKLFSVKVGDEIYYVAAANYKEAEEKFFERTPTPLGTTPDKIALVCGEGRLIL